MPGETLLDRWPTETVRIPAARDRHAVVPGPQAPEEEHSYYDVSMLKPPVWSWEVAAYFFFGGVSAGAYVLARAAHRFGGRRYRPVVRAGTAVAALAAMPCAPLLIADLGDPKRFHHMLRVWKPQSPMNLGAWTLTAYSGVVTAAVLREWLRGDGAEVKRTALSRLSDGVLLAVTDAAGVPLALLLAGYTGVLLSGTSTPLWSKSIWLGPMFSASALATGAEAVRLALGLKAVAGGADAERCDASLKKVDTLAHVAEGLTLAGFHAAASPFAEPLVAGKAALPFWGALSGLIVGELLSHLPLRGRARRRAGPLSAAVGLAAGWAMRWAIVHAGPPSANDPHAARLATRRPKPA
jgi:Ni/Fe-hydrogenase subunit HybB-like protein